MIPDCSLTLAVLCSLHFDLHLPLIAVLVPMDGSAVHPIPMAPVAPPTTIAEASEHPDKYVPEIVRMTFLPHFYQKFKEKVSA